MKRDRPTKNWIDRNAGRHRIIRVVQTSFFFPRVYVCMHPRFYIVSKFWERHVNERWSGLSAHPFRETRSLAVTIQHEWRLASYPVIASCSLAFLSVRREEWLRQQNAFRQSRATPAFSSRRWPPSSSSSSSSCSASSIRLVLPVCPLFVLRPPASSLLEKSVRWMSARVSSPCH